MSDASDLPVVVAITGASGVIYGQRLVECLLQAGETVHLTVSDSARQVIRHELGLILDLDRFERKAFLPDLSDPPGRLHYHHWQDWFTPIASGSFRTRAMVICPCSGGTLGGIAHSLSSNLVQRAAEVHLKERRKLVLVTRETPLSLVQIENMRAVTLAGAVVLPAAPGFYHGARSMACLVDFVVSRILDQIGVGHALMQRWGSVLPEGGGESG